MRIVFMGTPDFAVPCLDALLRDGYDVAAVFCQPDKPKGRGYHLIAPPVKELAVAKGIPVYQPVSLRDETTLQILQDIGPDLIVVVAYGKILPKSILDLPPLGCINVHGSLLPKLRGAAPIQWSVINGDPTTGITIMYLAEGMDTGDMILKEELDIDPQETTGELFVRMSQLGAGCLSKAVALLERGEVTPTKQDESMATYAPMLDKTMGNLDFSKTASQIVNLVRGLNPSPCAYTYLNGKRLKVLKAMVAEGFGGSDGQILDTKRFIVGCGGGQQAVELVSVQPEGKKPMDGAAFICGRPLTGKEMLTSG